jgi:hypothetical protein
MTGFLNRLAGMALGESGPNAAFASLPARFVPPASALTERSHDQLSEREATDRSESASPEPLLQPPRRARRTPDRESPGEAPHSNTDLPRAVALSSPLSLTSQEHSPSSRNGSGTDNAPSEQASEARMPSARAWPVASSRVVAPPQTAAASRFDASTTERTAIASASLLPMLPASRSDARAAPLSDTAVASRMSTSRDERPIIHVTIDRIDVRAPAPDKPGTAVRRPRAEPAVSLSEYLRRGAPGVRQ